MSDEDIRYAERKYRISGSSEDGEVWVQAVMRVTVPSVSLITQSIRTHRALQAVACSFVGSTNPYRLEAAFSKAMNQPVTPYDIVSFLRGGLEWVKSEYVAPSDTQGRRCIEPDCDQPATEQGFYPNPVFCWAHYCAIHSIDPSICGIIPSNSIFPCSLSRDHQDSHNSIVT